MALPRTLHWRGKIYATLLSPFQCVLYKENITGNRSFWLDMSKCRFPHPSEKASAVMLALGVEG